MSVIKKQFGERVKVLRKSKGFTQEALAESIGINLRQLARIEAGESFISSDTLYKICNTFKTSPKTLFDFDIDNTNKEPNLLFNVIENEHALPKEYTVLKKYISEIVNDTKKLEYMILAYKSLENKKSLNELKILIKGIELTQ